MATPKQISYIESLMEQHGITRAELGRDWHNYEDLPLAGVSALIDWLKGEPEAAVEEIPDALAWKVMRGLVAERQALRDEAASWRGKWEALEAHVSELESLVQLFGIVCSRSAKAEIISELHRLALHPQSIDAARTIADSANKFYPSYESNPSDQG